MYRQSPRISELPDSYFHDKISTLLRLLPNTTLPLDPRGFERLARFPTFSPKDRLSIMSQEDDKSTSEQKPSEEVSV